MAHFYRMKNGPDDPIWVYSERGVLNYVFCALRDDCRRLLLTEAVNGEGQRLGDVVGTPISHRLLTEFELNNDGFGSPDNGLFIKSESNTSFVFIEGKAVPLENSWKQPTSLTREEVRQLSDDALNAKCRKNTFNSAINGQLEMRWRFVNAFQAAKSRSQTLVTEDLSPPPQSLMENDRFYWRRRFGSQRAVENDWRRVSLGNLAPLWEMLLGVDEFYLMAITDDTTRPERIDQVRLFDGNRTPLSDIHSRVFWMPFGALADLLDRMSETELPAVTLEQTTSTGKATP